METQFKKLPITGLRIALLLPCLNEELTLAKVIRDFRNEIPNIDVYVFDNGSTDKSRQIAYQEGAVVIPVPRRGKGNVVRKMFEVAQADLYIMVDSDDTYDAKGVWKLLSPVMKGDADMVVGSREAQAQTVFRKFHRFGNQLIIQLINTIFKSSFTDICSGYRVMNDYFVKNIPLLRDGFEVETELTVYSLMNGFNVKEIPLPYGNRPENSHSKLNTFKDGYKVLLTIIWLMRDLRPLLFFSSVSAILFLGGMFGLQTQFIKYPFLQTVVAVSSISIFATGLLLNTINVKFSELQVLARRQSRPMQPPKVVAQEESTFTEEPCNLKTYSLPNA